MTDYDTAIADMEAKLEELRQARGAEKVPSLPDVPGFYKSTGPIWHLDVFGQWRHWYGAGRFDLAGILRTNEEMTQFVQDYGPLVRQKLVDA